MGAVGVVVAGGRMFVQDHGGRNVSLRTRSNSPEYESMFEGNLPPPTTTKSTIPSAMLLTCTVDIGQNCSCARYAQRHVHADARQAVAFHQHSIQVFRCWPCARLDLDTGTSRDDLCSCLPFRIAA